MSETDESPRLRWVDLFGIDPDYCEDSRPTGCWFHEFAPRLHDCPDCRNAATP